MNEAKEAVERVQAQVQRPNEASCLILKYQTGRKYFHSYLEQSLKEILTVQKFANMSKVRQVISGLFKTSPVPCLLGY